MNNGDRKEIIEVINIFKQQKTVLEHIMDEIQYRADNVEDKFPGSDRANKLQDEADKLQDVVDCIDDIISDLKGVQYL